MELIDFQERTDLKAKYAEMNFADFYRKYLDQDKFPNLRMSLAFKMALFGSTYLCEQFFSKMCFLKSSYRSVITRTDRRTLGKWTYSCQHLNLSKFE